MHEDSSETTLAVIYIKLESCKSRCPSLALNHFRFQKINFSSIIRSLLFNRTANVFSLAL